MCGRGEHEGGGSGSPPSETLELSQDRRPPRDRDTPPTWQPPRLERYELIRILGEGGMGVVYLARDRKLERRVAIKFLHELDDGLLKRLEREARTLAQITHPNVVAIHHYDEQDGVPYIDYEHVPGHSLDHCAVPMPWRQVLQHGIHLAAGLAAVHRQGLLHRDIKPANVILTECGQVKLIDFGLAKHVGADSDGGTPPDGSPRSSATGSSRLAGTPSYMAPELWDDAAPSPRSDVYSCGAVFYELCTGHKPPHPMDLAAWQRVRLDDIEPGFADVVRRCLHPRADMRYASGAALQKALESVRDALDAPRPPDNPYLGLRPFDSAHRHVFFGRDDDIGAVLERLGSEPLVVVIGDSGVGKSSLMHAGVLPHVRDGVLANGRAYRIGSVIPGRAPLAELVRALADSMSIEDPELLDQARAGRFDAIAQRVRAHHRAPVGTVLFIDQLEELVTLSDPDDAALTGRLLAHLVEQRIEGLHVLATLRGDHLTRMVRLPGLGPLLQRLRFHYLDPLKPAAIREAVVGPASAAGVRFESEDLIDELVDTAHQHDGGLPLLQFVLAELWTARDRRGDLIASEALRAVGGVGGALSRHADRVLDALPPGGYAIAREILIALVTPGRTRRRCTRRELELACMSRRRAPNTGDARDVLDSLIRGRLVVAHSKGGDVLYEIAHEALVSKWSTLASWLDQASGTQHLKERLSGAAEEWERLGRGRDGLWSRQQLAEVEGIDTGDLPERDRAFLSASRRALLRRRRGRRLVVAAMLLALAIPLAVAYYNQVERRRIVDGYLRLAARTLDEAGTLRPAFDRHRRVSADLFRANQRDEGLAQWQRSLELEPDLELLYREADRALGLALELDPDRMDARQAMATLIDQRARFADALGRHQERDELVRRLLDYSEAAYIRWIARVDVRVRIEPAASQPDRLQPDHLYIDRYRAAKKAPFERERVEDIAPVHSPVERSLEPGSYVLIAEWREQGFTLRYPFLIRPGAEPIDIALSRPPRLASMKDEFVYIPAGPFRFGYGQRAGDETLRQFYMTLPLHTRHTGAYWIGRHEVTYGDWMEFLQTCRTGDCPRAGSSEAYSGVVAELLWLGSDRWQLTWSQPGANDRAVLGQPLVYEARSRNAAQRWENMPVVGLSRADIEAYMAWLRRTGRVPGARLCREDEWERAARGADGRGYPHGDVLRPTDANIDATYGQTEGAYGPDEVGSYSASVSPFGLFDMAGNAWEMTTALEDRAGSSARTSDQLTRGGSFYHGTDESHAANRWIISSDARVPLVGFRVCADAAPR